MQVTIRKKNKLNRLNKYRLLVIYLWRKTFTSVNKRVVVLFMINEEKVNRLI